ncbi:polysaccharide biosynthesis tyrosine autokinase [Verrucomicrobiota bacterium sgz303538]
MDSINPPPPARSHSGNLGVKLYRYRTLIARRWWILALTIGLGLAFQGWKLHNKERLFESTSQLSVREELNVQEVQKFRQQDETFAGTTRMMLRSPEVLERARQRLLLEAPHLTGPLPEISAELIPRTSIFEVKGTGVNGEHTRAFVDAVVGEFRALKREQRQATLGQASGGLADQANRLQQELTRQQAELQAFVTKNNMPFWSQQAKQSAEFLSGLKTRQAQLQTELNRLEQLTPDQLLSSPPAGARAPQTSGTQSGSEDSQGGSFAAELYQQYLQTTQQLIQRQAELDERSRVWKPKHPKLQAIKGDVERLQRLLDVIKDQNRNATEARKVTIQGDLKSIESSIESWNQKVLEANSKDAEYKVLEANIVRTQNLLEKLWASASAITTGPLLDPLTVIMPATSPVEVSKGTAKHLTTGAIGGLILGLIILVLIDRSDDRVASSSEVLTHFTEPILGQIPNVAESRRGSVVPLIQADDERYTYAEAFRSLRSSLIFMPSQSELKTLLVTSAIPNEGKSTIASNLAITMAAAGARTLLVDADLRRGDLATLIGTDCPKGLTNVLRGEVKWDAVTQATRCPQLTLLCRGPVTNQTGELLLTPLLKTLLEEMRAQYDMVIFNTAPILATDDTSTLAPHFDGALMVMRAQFTGARLTQNALNALYHRQVNVLGLVLNCLDTDMPDYYYYRYPKYYAA